MRYLASLLLGLVGLCGVLWASDLPISLKHCATRGYPRVIYSGDTLAPGVSADTYQVYINDPVVLTAIMGVDDSSGLSAQNRCNCDTIEARWDSTACDRFYYRFRMRLWRQQPNHPTWTLTSEKDSLRNIDIYADGWNGTCFTDVGCPHVFTFPAVSFNREGVGYLKVQGRVQNYNNDYLAPAGDTCKVWFRVVDHPAAGLGSAVMIAH